MVGKDTSAPGSTPRTSPGRPTARKGSPRSVRAQARASSSHSRRPRAASPRRHESSASYTAESAGQCGPCVFGLPALASATADWLARGTASTGTVVDLRRWSGDIDRRGACRHPDGAVRLLRSAAGRRSLTISSVTRPGARAAGQRSRSSLPPAVTSCGDDRRVKQGATALRLSVDPIAARDGYGVCAELFHEWIRLDDWGYPIIDGDEIPPALVARARWTVEQLPGAGAVAVAVAVAFGCGTGRLERGR